MRSWQDQCADIIDFLEHYIKDTKFKISFGRRKDEWTFWVEKIRSDGGPHDGTGVSWLYVSSDNVDNLPEKMRTKAEDALLKWQQECFDLVADKFEQWQKARSELDKRLDATKDFERLKVRLVQKSEESQ